MLHVEEEGTGSGHRVGGPGNDDVDPEHHHPPPVRGTHGMVAVRKGSSEDSGIRVVLDRAGQDAEDDHA